MRITLNALDRDSSSGHSKEVIVGSMLKLQSEIAIFEQEVPFSRWYPDHEFISGSTDEEKEFTDWNKSL